jgi:Arc/MetJ family transcription regulator
MMPNVRRTSMNLDLELVEQAKAELGTNGTTETVHAALDEVVRRARIQRLLESTAASFSEPPPDGFDNWNDWIEETAW